MGKVYGERWETLASLGEGGQARAFHVRDLQSPDGDERWVLKRLKNTQRIGRFEDEIKALLTIESPRIPRVEDYSLGDPAYLVYPYIGPSLDQVADTLSFDQALDLYWDVAEAVSAAHYHNVVHRDLKPQNIVVDENPDGRRAYLIDFGICQIEDGHAFTVTEEPLGSRSFAAPELEAGSPVAVGPKSDVYSLGKLLYWMVMQGKMFARENFGAAIQSVPVERGVERSYVRNLLSRVLIDPTERISAQTLATSVARCNVHRRC